MDDENAVMATQGTEQVQTIEPDENVFRRGIRENPRKRILARQKLWMDSLQHEYPMPYQPYRIGVYIRFFNQTKYSDEVYLEKHKQWFLEDIALCRKWQLVDFYVDKGSTAPHMENSPEWMRLLDDCFAGKIDLIVTQKAGNISEDPDELNFISRILAHQKNPVAIYFISEDIYTAASYFHGSLTDRELFPDDWKPLPEDELDLPMLSGNAKVLSAETTVESEMEIRGNKNSSAMSEKMNNSDQEQMPDVNTDE